MTLDAQINTLFYSFLFGIYFSLIIDVNYKITLKLKKIYIIISTFLVIFSSVIFYFLILLRINNGIIHPYGIILLLIGCLFEHIIEKQIKK